MFKGRPPWWRAWAYQPDGYPAERVRLPGSRDERGVLAPNSYIYRATVYEPWFRLAKMAERAKAPPVGGGLERGPTLPRLGGLGFVGLENVYFNLKKSI